MPTVTVAVGSRPLSMFELQALAMYGRGHQIVSIAARFARPTEDLHPVMLLCGYNRQQARAFARARRYPGVQQAIEPTRPNPVPERLTLPRGERDVLAAFALGMSVGQVAAERGVSPSSVSKMLSRVLIRLNVLNRVDAIRKAVQLGLIEEPPPPPQQPEPAPEEPEALVAGRGRRTRLTEADKQIMRLFAAGQTVQQIALAMGVRHQTAHDRMKRITAYLQIEFTRESVTAALAQFRDDIVGVSNAPLTPIMLSTLAMLHEGADPRRIAERMNVTERNARARLGVLCSRMGVLNPVDALQTAIDNGLFIPPPVVPVVEVAPVPIVKRRHRETNQQWWERLTPVQRTAYMAIAAGAR